MTNNRASLIKLIHVAKRELALDDEAYKAAIDGVAKGKTSSADLTVIELENLLERFKSAGFKRQSTASKRRRKSPVAGTPVRTPEISKIRAIWITMHRHGLVRDSSEAALNSYVQRMTVKLNGGVGVAEVGWLDEALAVKVLEALKGWHRRLMLARIVADLIQPPRNERTGKPAGYDAVLGFYEERYEDKQS